MSNRSPGPDQQYCPNCRAIISRRAEMCPECNTFDVSAGAPSPTGRSASRTDPAGGSTAPTGSAGSGGSEGGAPPGVEDAVEAVERGHLYAVAGGVSLLSSVLTLVLAYLLTFSFLIGVLVLPLSGLFGIVGTGLGYYSLVAHRSKLGGGVAVVGTLEALVVLGTVLLGVLILFGVVALSNPWGIVRALYWLYELLSEIVGVVAVVAG